MAAFGSLRRNVVLASCTALVLMGLLLARNLSGMDRFGHVETNSFWPDSSKVHNAAAFLSAQTEQEKLGSTVKTSRFHFLTPASKSNLQFCYNLASATANRYPPPVLLGWNGQGEFDAAVTHLAKIRAMKRYLASLTPEEDDDLVLMVDGYDIIHQLPAEVMMERYFDVAAKATALLAERLGLPAHEASRRNIKQTVFFGPDKICWPPDKRAARCWAAPPSSLGHEAFGPDGGPDDFFSADPRWLNSGTIMGPVSDVRRVVDATMEEIEATYNKTFWQSDSDQYYMANVWGRQEYWRRRSWIVGSQGGDAGDQEAAQASGWPSSARVIPEKRRGSQEIEMHMAIEYESSLFQTMFGNEPFLGHLEYSRENETANVTMDLLGQGGALGWYAMQMPQNVRAALMKLYDSVSGTHPGASAEDWIRTVPLGTNLVTKHIYGLWHCTGGKEFLDTEYRKMWFFPLARSLAGEAVKASRRGEALSSRLIDGRKWVARWAYPGGDQDVEDWRHGGAWSDEAPGRFVGWTELCGPHESVLFQGQRRRQGQGQEARGN
ncbi:hypothetical protein UVI_02057550 [Ustilaginoidea virens]|uniref:Uncharacterized protein n=2 Tax=Ustilaginoidea virens TaxID=1159556 RepID=A0A063C2M1_USTVR|nr:hypothetical protein UVI_02057550 [Ustilaginoidea virens]